jgi:hypothetical protein
MANIWMDDDSKATLDKIREQLKAEGIGSPTYGDAVRRLVKNQTEEVH